MYLISHRGNLNGILPEKENNPKYLKIALEKGTNSKQRLPQMAQCMI